MTEVGHPGARRLYVKDLDSRDWSAPEPPSRQFEKVGKQAFPFRCSHGFGMKLHAVDRVASVCQRHDLTTRLSIGGPGDCLELGWEAIRLNDEGVIPHDLHRRRDAFKQRVA